MFARAAVRNPSADRRWLGPSLVSAAVLIAGVLTWPAAGTAEAQTTRIQINDSQFGWSQFGEPRRWGRPRPEVEPYELNLTAFQAGDQVVIFAKGSHRTGGVSVSLERAPFQGRPRVTLRHYAPGPDRCGTQAITPFEVIGSLTVRGRVSSVGIVVCGRLIQVPVVCVPQINTVH